MKITFFAAEKYREFSLNVFVQLILNYLILDLVYKNKSVLIN